VTLEWEREDIRSRDQRDASHKIGPLRRTAKMHYIDTTHMTPEAVLAEMEEVARRCLAQT
jgi:cytidylate kinase